MTAPLALSIPPVPHITHLPVVPAGTVTAEVCGEVPAPLAVARSSKAVASVREPVYAAAAHAWRVLDPKTGVTALVAAPELW